MQAIVNINFYSEDKLKEGEYARKRKWDRFFKLMPGKEQKSLQGQDLELLMLPTLLMLKKCIFYIV